MRRGGSDDEPVLVQCIVMVTIAAFTHNDHGDNVST